MRQLLALLVVVVATRQAAAQNTALGASKLQLERVVAVVDDSVILQSELDMRVWPSPQLQSIVDPLERERQLRKLVAHTLDDMVNEELMTQAAAAARVEVSDSEVQAAIDEIKQQNGLDDHGLEIALGAQAQTLSSYRLALRRQLERLRMINQVVSPKVQVTDQDVRAHYDELQRRSTTALAPYDELKDELKNELRRRELDKQTALWVDALRRKAYVVIKTP